MYENIYSKEKQNFLNGDTKISQNQFTKSLTSFHSKKTIPNNIYQQNLLKNLEPINQEKTVKNKRIYFSR